MSVINGIVSAPVSIYDIQQILGNGSTDLGTLCRASQINKWAKYKPERINKIGIITHAERRFNMFGFTKYSQPYNETSLLNPAKHYSDYWGYNKPRGGDYNEPYRLTDFVKNPNDPQQTINLEGYRHQAVVPVSSELVNALSYYRNGYYLINKAEQNTITFIAYENPSADFLMKDLVPLEVDSYCIVVERYTTNPLEPNASPVAAESYIGSAMSVANPQSSVTIPLTSLAIGTYYFLVGIQQVSGGQREGGTVILMPTTPEQEYLGRLPFFFQCNIESFLTQQFKIVGLGYGLMDGTFTYDSSQMCWKASYISSTVLFIHMQVTKSTYEYYFASVNATIPSGARRMTVYILSYDGGSNMALRPCDSSRQYFTNNYTVIPSSTQQNDWYDIYGTVDVSQVPGLNLNDYRVHFFAGKASLSDGVDHDMGSFAIQRT